YPAKPFLAKFNRPHLVSQTDSDMTRHVLIVGAGAIGGVLCAYLESAGQPTSLFARGENARNIGRDGIRLTTPDGRALHVRPRVVTEATGLAPQDMVILATKSFSLPAAMAAAAPAIGADTIVMPVVNGVPWWFGSASEPLRSVDPDGALAAAVPYERLVGATIYAPTRRVSPSEWVHSGLSKLVIGAVAPADSTAHAQSLAELFRGSTLAAIVAGDI